MEFTNKVVLITGSSSGIGKGAAHSFARKGAKIVLASRNEQANEMLLAEIKEQGGAAIFVPTDIAKKEDIKNLIDRVVETFGTIDIAVNNAGIEYRMARVRWGIIYYWSFYSSRWWS